MEDQEAATVVGEEGKHQERISLVQDSLGYPPQYNNNNGGYNSGYNNAPTHPG